MEPDEQEGAALPCPAKGRDEQLPAGVRGRIQGSDEQERFKEDQVKALSVRAPWWWFILHGGKDIENRDWSSGFRGTIYLHASKWFNLEEVRDDAVDAMNIFRSIQTGLGFGAEMTFRKMKGFGGCLVGKVDIVDCVSRSASPWFFGEYGFVLRNPVAFERPIPFKGALGFFEVPDGIEDQP
jgi:hypothetical protein